MNADKLASPHQVWTQHCQQLQQEIFPNGVEISPGPCHPNQKHKKRKEKVKNIKLTATLEGKKNIKQK